MRTKENQTQAQAFCEAADWLGRQEYEFTKHFKSGNSILRVWDALPKEYNPKNKFTRFVKTGKEWYKTELANLINFEFGFRYFENAELRYYVTFGIRKWGRNADHLEVYRIIHDRYNKKKVCDNECMISIESEKDALGAYEKLYNEAKEDCGDEMQVYVREELKKVMKKCKPSNKEYEVMYAIPGL